MGLIHGGYNLPLTDAVVTYCRVNKFVFDKSGKQVAFNLAYFTTRETAITPNKQPVLVTHDYFISGDGFDLVFPSGQSYSVTKLYEYILEFIMDINQGKWVSDVVNE